MPYQDGMAGGGLEQLPDVLPRGPQLGCLVPRSSQAQRTPPELLRRRQRKKQSGRKKSRTCVTAGAMGEGRSRWNLGGEEEAAKRVERGAAGDPAAEELADGHVGAGGGAREEDKHGEEKGEAAAAGTGRGGRDRHAVPATDRSRRTHARRPRPAPCDAMRVSRMQAPPRHTRRV